MTNCGVIVEKYSLLYSKLCFLLVWWGTIIASSWHLIQFCMPANFSSSSLFRTVLSVCISFLGSHRLGPFLRGFFLQDVAQLKFLFSHFLFVKQVTENSCFAHFLVSKCIAVRSARWAPDTLITARSLELDEVCVACVGARV